MHHHNVQYQIHPDANNMQYFKVIIMIRNYKAV